MTCDLTSYIPEHLLVQISASSHTFQAYLHAILFGKDGSGRVGGGPGLGGRRGLDMVIARLFAYATAASVRLPARLSVFFGPVSKFRHIWYSKENNGYAAEHLQAASHVISYRHKNLLSDNTVQYTMSTNFLIYRGRIALVCTPRQTLGQLKLLIRGYNGPPLYYLQSTFFRCVTAKAPIRWVSAEAAPC